jgi:hypothetical protein
MKSPQQLVELAIVGTGWASREGAAKRRGDTGLVGQAVHTDDPLFHRTLGRCLHCSFAGH